MDSFEMHADGWFMWSWKAPGAWGWKGAREAGIFPKVVTDRNYFGQCENGTGGGQEEGYASEKACE